MVDYTDQSPLAHSQLWHSRFRAVPVWAPFIHFLLRHSPEVSCCRNPIFGAVMASQLPNKKSNDSKGPRAGPPQMKQDQSVQFNNQTQHNINTGDYK